MRLYIVILLCVLVSCNKRESKTLHSGYNHQNDSSTVCSSQAKNIDGYIGKWSYDVWINDSAFENKSFWLELKKAGKDSINGLFASIWENGMKLDGWNADTEIKSNVWGRIVNDSLFVNIKGSYNENSTSKAVLYLVNDSTLLWEVIDEYIYGDIYIPEKIILKKDN